MTALASQLGDLRRSEFRRMLAVSALLHVGGFLLFAISPTLGVRPTGLPAVIPVELVELGSAPASAKARIAPAPKPAPALPKPAPPPVPVKKKVVLPAEPAPPKPKAQPKPEPRPQPQRRELDPSQVAPPAPPEAQDYEDVLAQLRAEAGEQAPAAPQAPAQVAAVPAAATGGAGGPVSPEVAAWITRVKIHVRRHWAVPPGFRTQPLATALRVRLAADGTLLGAPEIVRRSGNPWYDDGVMRGIQKASPLPAPPEAGEWPITFSAQDSY